MADVSGHQFNRKSFDLMTESPPCNISKISIGLFLTWSNNFLQRSKRGAGSYQNLAFLGHTSCYLWVELIFIVIEGVSGGRNGENMVFTSFVLSWFNCSVSTFQNIDTCTNLFQPHLWPKGLWGKSRSFHPASSRFSQQGSHHPKSYKL